MAPLDPQTVQHALAQKQVPDALQAAIETRVQHILQRLAHVLGWTIHWHDFENEQGEEGPGYFDPEAYAHHIQFIGDIDFGQTYRDFDEYQWQFPTRWLYEDFGPELTQKAKAHLRETQAEHAKTQKSQHEAAQAIAQTLAAFKAALTPEEQLFFKVPDKLTPEQQVALHEKMKVLSRVSAETLSKIPSAAWALLEIPSEAEYQQRHHRSLAQQTKHLSKEERAAVFKKAKGLKST